MERSDRSYPTIYIQRCTDCGCCIEVCPSAVFDREVDQVVPAQPERCEGCGECEMVCPEDAVEVSFAIVWADTPQAEAGSDTGPETDSDAG